MAYRVRVPVREVDGDSSADGLAIEYLYEIHHANFLQGHRSVGRTMGVLERTEWDRI